MHEMSLAENIVQIIEEAAAKQQFAHVKAVWLEIGQLACVETESLRFYFDIVAQDTIAKQCRLEIVEVAGQANCNQCKCIVSITTYYEACPRCGSFSLQITQGDGMQIKELEVG